MTDIDTNDIIPEIDLVVNSIGITIYCASRLNMPRFVPFDVRGRCTQCRGDGVDIEYIIDMHGITLYSTRMNNQKFVPFDRLVYFDEIANRGIKIKHRGKHFTIPIKKAHPRNQGTTFMIPTAMLKGSEGKYSINFIYLNIPTIRRTALPK